MIDLYKNKYKKLWIVTDGKLFPQRYNTTQSIQIDLIKDNFVKLGYEVNIISYDEVVNKNIQIQNAYVYYASSQFAERKQYIDDVLMYINRFENQNILLPNYDVFRCHENKGYQEIYKKIVGLESLNGLYHIDFIESKDEQPFVLKLVDGYGSKNVSLVKNKDDFEKKYNENVKIKNSVLDLKRWVKKNILNRKEESGLLEYYKCFYTRRYVKQPLVPNLKYDFKVLVFDNKVYVLKRNIKEGDFRASGSGLWEFPNDKDVSRGLLDFAYYCYKKLDIPFVSLDICTNDKEFFLIEFQGLHFGPVTILDSKGYFDYDNSWKFMECKSSLEDEIGNSLINYIKRKEDK